MLMAKDLSSLEKEIWNITGIIKLHFHDFIYNFPLFIIEGHLLQKCVAVFKILKTIILRIALHMNTALDQYREGGQLDEEHWNTSILDTRELYSGHIPVTMTINK